MAKRGTIHLAGYIEAVDKLLMLARRSYEPPAHEVKAARDALSHCPVRGYASFTAKEVRLVGYYLCRLDPDATYWKAIASGLPEAWMLAVHEAAELDAFSQAKVNPFDAEEWEAYQPEAHLQAIATEVQFLKAWADQLAIDVSEAAIEQSNPFRKQFSHQHRINLARLATRLDWDEPEEADIAAAEQFWDRILKEVEP
jgi:hypothetical protein